MALSWYCMARLVLSLHTALVPLRLALQPKRHSPQMRPITEQIHLRCVSASQRPVVQLRSARLGVRQLHSVRLVLLLPPVHHDACTSAHTTASALKAAVERVIRGTTHRVREIRKRNRRRVPNLWLVLLLPPVRHDARTRREESNKDERANSDADDDNWPLVG